MTANDDHWTVRSPTSQVCYYDDHQLCPHWRALGGSFDAPIILCECDCHAGCGLPRVGSVTFGDYVNHCTCPGAEESRESFRGKQGRFEELARRQHQAEDALVARGVPRNVVQGAVKMTTGLVTLGLVRWLRRFSEKDEQG